ncbi:MAG TPA: sigma-70 family RNA polymerase sigma factor [Solirubrobacteraceae bacterium]|nr:sigma-70 family RNA polymerase sigma factor [Solirubrobacteraceae bacterium]
MSEAIASGTTGVDRELADRLAGGDEGAFRELVRKHDAGLRRMARMYVADAVADDVVQDTWITVIRGIDRFEGRSTLKTWIYGILVNIARRRAEREGRTVPFAAAGSASGAWGGSVDLERLHHPDLGLGYWPAAPTWARDPARAAVDNETRAVVLRALSALVPSQREVMVLRDIEGWSGPEVCEVLGISDVNQRTLLHRARVTVRAVLEEYFND